MRVRRIAWILGMALAGIAGPEVHAASIHPPARMEMLVLLPSGQHIAVYEQVSVAPTRTLGLGVMPHAIDLHAAGHATVQPASAQVILHGGGMKFAVRYKVGWNGRSGSYLLPFEQPTGALIVLLPATLRLPSVLNPALALAGRGKIPGVAGSPEFDEYTTAQIPAGDTLNLVLERNRPSLAGAAAPLSAPRAPKAVGALLQGVIASLALAGGWAAFSLRPLAAKLAALPESKDRLLEELARLEATFWRGELSDDVYDGDRAELMRQLRPDGDTGVPSG